MSVYEFGPFRLDAASLLLLDGDEPIALGPKVVETLLALVEHPGDVMTKAELLDRIWPEGYVDEANLAQNVYVLRKILRARAGLEVIETIPRRGYRFTAAVAILEQLPPSRPAAAVVHSPTQTADIHGRALHGMRRALSAVAVLVLAAGIGIGAAVLAPARGASPHALSSDGARLYQIGRYYWNLRTPDGTAKSLQYFARVVDTDPQDARGYAALASANAIMGDYGYGKLLAKVYFARAKAYARKALDVDSRCGEAYAVLGMLSSRGQPSKAQMSSALSQLRRAIALDPNSGPAHEWYGVALFERGRFREAYTELHRAAELDPLSVATAAWLGSAAYLQRRYGDAIDYANEALDLAPHRIDVYQTLGLAYEARGEDVRAIAAFRRLRAECAPCRPEASALLAEAYAKANRFPEAREQIAYAKAHASEVDPGDLAIALATVGRRGDALAYLRRADAFVKAEIASDPRFDGLRGDFEAARPQKPA
jgi:DNA-binding winged helix-turn-helix (wHTH) protein/predicted Zn-dependent protease